MTSKVKQLTCYVTGKKHPSDEMILMSKGVYVHKTEFGFKSTDVIISLDIPNEILVLMAQESLTKNVSVNHIFKRAMYFGLEHADKIIKSPLKNKVLTMYKKKLTKKKN